jgi:hypothetical protein
MAKTLMTTELIRREFARLINEHWADCSVLVAPDNYWPWTYMLVCHGTDRWGCVPIKCSKRARELKLDTFSHRYINPAATLLKMQWQARHGVLAFSNG